MSLFLDKSKHGSWKFRLKDGTTVCVFFGGLMGLWWGSFYVEGSVDRVDVPLSSSRRKVFRALRLAIAKATNPAVQEIHDRLTGATGAERKVLVVAKNYQRFSYEVEGKIHLQVKQDITVKVSRSSGRAQIGNTSYTYMDRPDAMRGYRGVEVEFWGDFHGMPQEDLDLYKIYAESARRN